MNNTSAHYQKNFRAESWVSQIKLQEVVENFLTSYYLRKIGLSANHRLMHKAVQNSDFSS